MAEAFAEAIEGNGAAILDANDAIVDRSTSRTATTCNDHTLLPPPTIEEIVDERLYVYEHVSKFAFAAANLENDDFGCEYWNVTPPPEKFQGPWNHTLRNPILVVSNTVS